MRRTCLLVLLGTACAPALESKSTPTTAPGSTGGPTDTEDHSSVDSGASADDDPVEVIESRRLTLEASADRGFYDAPFELVLTASDPEASIRWTVDGSDPRTGASARDGEASLTLQVDPGSLDGRDATPGFVVRAMAWRDGYESSPVLTHTFLFPAEVARLSPHNEAPGAGWPGPYETDDIHDRRHAMDYGLDPRITEDPLYGPLLVDALTDIPSVSIATDLPHLFDDDDGIYVNPMGHGEDWERPASVEIIDPADLHEVQAGMGLRIRGGWSRHQSNPKHAFRLFFRSEYGDAKLHFALFDDEGPDEFDKVDLRTAQNYSWSFKGTEGRENTFLRDVFSRDLQRSLGQLSSQSRYYHLYLNGVYWGLYQTQERTEARFAETHLGGDVDDYDVVKVNGDDPSGRVIEATDGNLALWEEVWEYCEAGFADDTAYFALQGLDASGNRDPDRRVLVDVDNLIDYMLVIFYAGNFDSPTGAFTRNQGANNFFAIISREDPEHGFVFFAHDAEHSLLPTAWGPGIGLAEDRVNLGTRTDSYRMNVAGFEDFHPQWLHHKLTENALYRARFAERARVVLADDGPLAEAAVTALLASRAAEIELAIIAESARWGDTKSFWEDGRTVRTRDDDWGPAVDRILEDWVPYRRAIVIDQLETAGLW